MKWPPWLRRCTCLAALLAYWAAFPCASQAAAKPNIVFILSDDGGYNEYGFNAAVSGPGGTPTPNVAVTPNLDALAQQGIVARQAYAAPLCSESRAALLTGQYSQRSGIEENLGNNVSEPFGFATGQKILPSYLKDQGYTTGMIGKWHEGYTAGVNRPTDLGFDEYFGFLSGSRSYYSDFAPSNVMLRGNTNVESLWRTEGDASKYDPVRGRYATDAFGEESVNFINNHAHDVDEHGDPKPFFLYTAFNSPHTPFDVKTSDYNQAQIATINDPHYTSKRTTAAMIYGMDREVGSIMSALASNGVDNNTIIVFMNDNGGVGFPQPNGTDGGDDNSPLRGFKGLGYEGGIKVPFIIREPGLQHSIYNSPINELDLVPTLVNAAGGNASQIATDGVDLAPYLSGANTSDPHQEQFWRNRAIWAVRKGDWKLAHADQTAGQVSLFNVGNDPSESSNLIGVSQNNPKIAELLRDLTGWEATLKKPKYGVLGADDRNNFDHFVFRSDLVNATNNWSAANVWQEFGDPAHTVTMRVDDAYANAVLEFTTRNDASYTANDDMLRMSGQVFMLNQLQLTGDFAGSSAQSGTISGISLLFVKNLDGQSPRIQLDATATGASANFTFNLNIELQVYNDLEIAGNGTQNFVIGGQIRDYYQYPDNNNTTPHNVTKSGTSNVTLTANNTFKGTFTITGGQVHVNGASAAISAAAKIVIGNFGTLVLDNGSISVPTIDNSLHGDYNHNHQVDAADYTLWRDSFGQTGAGLAADGNGDGIVNQGDYDVWGADFGATSGGTLLVNGGSLKVATITGDVTNSGGTLASGAAPALRTIGGTLAENAGVLQVLIGGTVPVTNFDQIQIGGTATLGGTLTVQLVNGFNPLLNQTFQFLTSTGGVSGTFANLSLPSLGAGKAWQLVYGTNDLKLAIVAAGSAASVMATNYNQHGVLTNGPAVPEPPTITYLLLGSIILKVVRGSRARQKASLEIVASVPSVA